MMFSPTTKTHFYIRVTDKELVSNGEECSQKDGIPYFVIFTAIENHSLIIVDAVQLQNSSNNTFC